MRRVLTVLLVVVALVGCDPLPPSVSPGSGGSDVGVMVTPEEWHYVGEAGEPAFLNSWANTTGSDYPAMAFRIREAGVVDIQGVVTAPGTFASIFVLPSDYRPTTLATIPVAYRSGGIFYGSVVTVETSGAIRVAAGTTTGDVTFVSGQFFITGPTATP